MNKWTYLPKQMPLDGVVCWVRINYWFGQAFKATYSVANKEWTSVENALKYPVWSVCRWKYDQEFLYADLKTTGTGVGVSTLKMEVDRNQTLTLEGNARFYTDAAGTLGASSTWAVTTGAERTIYIKTNSGDSKLIITMPKNIVKFGTETTQGWAGITNCGQLIINTTNLGLTKFRVAGNAIITGLLPSTLQVILLIGETIYFDYEGEMPSGMTWIQLAGTNIKWQYEGILPIGLQKLHLDGNNMRWKYNGALPTDLILLYLYSPEIEWTFNGALPLGLTYIFLRCEKMDWTYNQILGSANITSFQLYDYRISKISSADLVTMLNSMTVKIGTFPTSIRIADYAQFAAPPAEVTTAVNALKAAKSITTVTLAG
jgi:hypothetical protein